MHTKFSTILSKRNLQVGTLSIVAIVSSFSLGIHSVGNVRPTALIEAGSVQQAGDVDGNGIVDVQDVKLILEIAQGYVTPTSMQLHADPNKDGKLTVDDAIRILSILSAE